MIEALEGPLPDPYAVGWVVVMGPIPTGPEMTPMTDEMVGARAPESAGDATAADVGGVDAFGFRAGDAFAPFPRPLLFPFGLDSPEMPDSPPAVGSATDSTRSSRKSYWRFCATRRFLKYEG